MNAGFIMSCGWFNILCVKMLWSHVCANSFPSWLSAGSSADLACRNVGQRKGYPLAAPPSSSPPPISFFSPAVVFANLCIRCVPATKAAIGVIITMQFKLSYTPCALNYHVILLKIIFFFHFGSFSHPLPKSTKIHKSGSRLILFFFFFFCS